MALYEITGNPQGTKPQTMATDEFSDAVRALRAIRNADRAARHPATVEARAKYKALPLDKRREHKFAQPSATD